MLNLMECTPIAQFAIGLDHKIVFVNRACELLTGINAEEIIGTDDQWRLFYDHKRPVLADLIIEQDFKRFQKLYEGKSPAKSKVVPFAWEATDYFENMGGKARHIYFLAAPVFDQENVMIGSVTTLQDITEQKLRETSMRQRSHMLHQENIKLKSSIQERYRFNNIIGKSEKMQDIYDLILKAADSPANNANVIIYGESGTGKELVARAIHDMSARHDKPFIPVNCGAIPDNLLESAFFGHEKGAFTGAHEKHKGFLEQADKGTLFLDEVGELELNMQVKLLRAIEGNGFTPVGSASLKHANFRIIAATNRNLLDEVNKGNVREDFYYRIHVIPINVPPLRERKEDIPLIVYHFLKNLNPNNGNYTLSGKVMDALYNYHWPGNVRELQNVINRYMTLNTLEFREEPHKKINTENNINQNEQPTIYSSFEETINYYEKKVLLDALNKYRWNKQVTAEKLSMNRRTLFRKLKKHEII
ncbi:MAG: PAS domain-containing protein [Gammaproteobacteria bacterium]|nr:MAG: PAS domain-containing protein [Gammaproteobacteria bacterium]